MSDKGFPSPDELRKEFEEFFRKRFGSDVKVYTQPFGQPTPEEDEPGTTESRRLDALKFDLKPKEVKAYLDRFVIRQEAAKKALAIAVCDHYHHVRRSLGKEASNIEYAKQNVLLLGPTGVGKTYLVRQIAKLIGVPFVKADATRFSETGYVGANVEDLIRDLVAQAGGDIELAQYGIVYLDEADKLATPSGRIAGRDVSGRGVQTGLLKLMEETEIDLTSGNDLRSQMMALLDMQKGRSGRRVINTRHILFLVSGAFSGLEDIIRRRLNQSGIGFAASRERLASDEDLLDMATTEDFVEYGFEPEFIGRLPIRVACRHLSEQDLYDILRHSEGSIVRQYQEAFAAYGINAVFTDQALRRIAARAADQKTGARALMTVCEAALRDFKYELPSSDIRDFAITEAVIERPAEELERLLQDPSYGRRLAQLKGIAQFEDEFLRRHEMEIEFSEDAADKIIELAEARGLGTLEFLTQHLASYEHGLKLIKQNLGRTSFRLGLDVIEAPQATLERMIRESYSSSAPQNPDG